MNGPQHYQYAEFLSNHATKIMNGMHEDCGDDEFPTPTTIMCTTALAAVAIQQAQVHAQLAEVALMFDGYPADRRNGEQWWAVTEMEDCDHDREKFENIVKDFKDA